MKIPLSLSNDDIRPNSITSFYFGRSRDLCEIDNNEVCVSLYNCLQYLSSSIAKENKGHYT